MRMLRWIVILILYSLTTACMYSGVVVTGAQTVYDRHNLQKKFSDNYTTMAAYRAIYLDTNQYENSNVSVAAFNNAVLITGQTPQLQQKQEIEAIVKKFAGDRKIYNYTEVTNPISYLAKVSDSWITTKIKTTLIATNEIEPSKIKVITENSIVYLMGIVPADQAEIAFDIAKNTSGVQDVVKIFSYLTISDTPKTETI